MTQFGLVTIPNWFGKMVDYSGFEGMDGFMVSRKVCVKCESICRYLEA